MQIKVFIEQKLLTQIESYDRFDIDGINALPVLLRCCETDEDIENWCAGEGYDFVHESKDEMLITAEWIDEIEFDPIYIFDVKETEE